MNTNCYIKVSVGELVDKYSILDIKRERIHDPCKLICIHNELDALNSALQYIQMYNKYYEQLKRVNTKIWDLTDIVKQLDTKHRLFSIVSNEIFELNQCRFRIKKYFNDLVSSDIKEQKSYSDKVCTVLNPESDLNALFDICIHYDTVYSNTNLGPPNVVSVLRDVSLSDVSDKSNKSVLRNKSDKSVIIDLNPIVYVATGLMGDFIMQLSVVCENYHSTGRRGIIYMIGPNFRKGVENTYNDIVEIVKMQPYIDDLRTGEPPNGCDMYLSSWRQRNDFYQFNWYQLLLSEYDIHLGKHPWLHAPILCEWTNKTVIHIAQYRFPVNIEFPHDDSVVLLALEPGDYDTFVSKTGHHQIATYTPANFTELCSIIYSCKKFIGALSMPLTLAHAMHVNRHVKLCGVAEPDTMNIGLINYIPGIDIEH
jgi:hypothetical protein